MPAVSWPESVFALDAGLGLAVCVAHRGGHVWYLSGCQALPTQRSRWERHLTSREPSPEPAPTPRVEIDMEGLAGGIALALDQLTERRRQQGRESRQEPANTRPQQGEAPLGGVPTVT
jgi:hypothetical protein